MSNLFDDVPRMLAAEKIDVVLETPGVRLERIVSPGGVTWVLVLRGRARVRIEGEAEARSLGVGDHLLLRAHVRHRVEWTDTAGPTIWLAIFYGAEGR